MPVIFKSHNGKFFLVTNYKVMYSTLMQQSNMQVLNGPAIKDLSTCIAKKYLIVRNPYHRLESFYRDKFLAHPTEAVYNENWRWQHCQQLFFDEYGFDKASFPEVRYALMTTTFEEFIERLPSKYMLDAHLQPQILAIYYREGVSLKMVDFDDVLRMENEADMIFLSRRLHIDISVRANETTSQYGKITWTGNSRKIVNDLYNTDFEQFDYATLDK